MSTDPFRLLAAADGEYDDEYASEFGDTDDDWDDVTPELPSSFTRLSQLNVPAVSSPTASQPAPPISIRLPSADSSVCSVGTQEKKRKGVIRRSKNDVRRACCAVQD